MTNSTYRKRSALYGIVFFVLALLAPAVAPGAPNPGSHPVKLVLAVVIDQFRYDYLARFRADYHGGIERALRDGAVLTDVRQVHYPTETATGHATLFTGATPSVSGIIENGWFDRESGKQVTAVGDETTCLLGGKEGPGASPRRLSVTTLGDEIKLAWRANSRVIGISWKDRSAVLPAGHMADGAYWFDSQTGSFVSSTYYFPDLPAWAKAFNEVRPAAAYAGREWAPLVPNPDYPAFSRIMPAAGPALYAALDATPFSNELLEQFAEAAIEHEQLGKHASPDLLVISFSGNDFVGHAFGPDSPEVRDTAIRTDRLLGKLLDYAGARVGLDDVLLVLTSDHGVAPVPENSRLPGGRLSPANVGTACIKALSAQYGVGRWITAFSGPFVYLNRELIQEKKLDESEVQRAAARAILRTPHILRVYTREQLEDGRVPGDEVSRSVVAGFHAGRAGDLVIVPEPYWISVATGSSHGAPFNYDAHVPLIFMGSSIQPGRYDEPVDSTAMAPTIAAILGVERPSGAFGRVIREVIRPAPEVRRVR